MAHSKLYQHLSRRDVFQVGDLPNEIRHRPHLSQQLAYLVRRGYLLRIRRGVYAVVPGDQIGRPGFSLDRFTVAAVLTRPYAVSFYSALEIKGLAESVGRRVYLQSPKQFKRFEFQDVEYVGVAVKNLFGVETVYRGMTGVEATDIERTLLDCLRFPKYAGGIDEFLRSLEGIQRFDLLSLVLDRALESGVPPARLKLRADLEDRRAELDHLEGAGLLAQTLNRLYLTLLGLSFCPHPAAEREMEVVRRMFAYLREQYKLDPDRFHAVQQIAKALELESGEAQRAAMVLVTTPLADRFITEAGSGWPNSIAASERILDYLDLNQFLARALPSFKLPDELSMPKRGLAFIRFDRLLDYLGKFGENALYCKAGFLLSLFRAQWDPPADVLRALTRKVGRKKSYFPPGLPPNSGRLIREWNLIVPSHLYTRYRHSLAPFSGEDVARV